MAITSVTGMGSQYPVDYNLMRQLLIAAKVRAPFFAGTLPGMLEKNAGTASVKWERIENLTKATTPLGELSGSLTLPTRSGVVPTITPITASMLKYGNTIFLNEELELMSVNARASRFMDTLGENAGATLNEIMADVHDAATEVRFNDDVANQAAVIDSISAADCQFIHNFLNRNGGQKFYPMGTGSVNIGSSPIRSSYMGVCHVDVEEDIRLLSGYIPVENYGSHVEVFPYEFGFAQGIRWCSTEEDSLITADAGSTAATNGMRSTSGTNADVYKSYIKAMDAVGSVGLGENHTKEIYKTGDRLPAVELVYSPPQASVADPQGEIGTLSWKAWFTGTVLNANWIVELQTGATAL